MVVKAGELDCTVTVGGEEVVLVNARVTPAIAPVIWFVGLVTAIPSIVAAAFWAAW